MVLAQMVLIAKCNVLGKPVVTATQRLESFTRLPRPTRAEASAVANTVLDDTDCVMFSGETAGGKFPIKEVTIMRRICKEAEAVIDCESLYLGIRMDTLKIFTTMWAVESMCSAAVKATIEPRCRPKAPAEVKAVNDPFMDLRHDQGRRGLRKVAAPIYR